MRQVDPVPVKMTRGPLVEQGNGDQNAGLCPGRMGSGGSLRSRFRMAISTGNMVRNGESILSGWCWLKSETKTRFPLNSISVWF